MERLKTLKELRRDLRVTKTKSLTVKDSQVQKPQESQLDCFKTSADFDPLHHTDDMLALPPSDPLGANLPRVAHQDPEAGPPDKLQAAQMVSHLHSSYNSFMKPVKQSKILGNKPRIQSSKVPNRSPQILLTQSGKPLKLKAN